jgi:hypothetical protein
LVATGFSDSSVVTTTLVREQELSGGNSNSKAAHPV